MSAAIVALRDANGTFDALIKKHESINRIDELQSLLLKYKEVEEILSKSVNASDDGGTTTTTTTITTTTATTAHAQNMSGEEFDGLLNQIDNESDLKMNSTQPQSYANFISKPVWFLQCIQYIL